MSVARKVFLAGATGAIGKPLLAMLVVEGCTVFGTTRVPARTADIERAGAKAVVIDMLDRSALIAKFAELKPDVVMHQLTDLPPGLDPARMADAVERNARIRREGTRNIIDAMQGCGCRRIVAQSIAWTYRPGPEPHREDDPLDTASEGARRITVDGAIALETLVLATPGIEGTALRYGNLYGPGTGRDTAGGQSPLHVDDAASAAMLAMRTGATGVFNIAEPNAYIVCDKAASVLGWQPSRTKP